MDEKMKQEFIEMLKEARGTPQEWAIIMEMVDMLDGEEEWRSVPVRKGSSQDCRCVRELRWHKGCKVAAHNPVQCGRITRWQKVRAGQV